MRERLVEQRRRQCAGCGDLTLAKTGCRNDEFANSAESAHDRSRVLGRYRGNADRGEQAGTKAGKLQVVGQIDGLVKQGRAAELMGEQFGAYARLRAQDVLIDRTETVALGVDIADPLIGLAITALILWITREAWRTIHADERHDHSD